MINACTGDIYQAGFHFFLKKEDAEEYKKWLVKGGWQFLNSNTKVIECKIKKSWITATGKNILQIDYTGPHYGKTIVTKKAIFPEYKE